MDILLKVLIENVKCLYRENTVANEKANKISFNNLADLKCNQLFD